MVRDAIAHRFDEDGFAAVFERHPAGFPGDFAHREDVVAVDADGVDAVTDAAAGDAVAAVLLDGCGGDGEAVVATDEDYGAGARGCDVEGGVEVSFAGGTFSEVAGYDSRWDLGVLEGLELECVGGAGGLRNLGSEGGRDCVLKGG